MKTQLIVNADDFGRTPGVSAGILAAHQQGIVTSTTALMNMPGVESALVEARQLCPRLGIGVHLVLTAGSPVLPPEMLPTLTAEQGKFQRLNELIPRLDALDPAEVRMEWQAQVRRFIDATGQKPDHLDSHHHFSYLSPTLFEIMLELADELGCPIRNPFGDESLSALSDLPPHQREHLLHAFPALIAKHHPPCPQVFISSFYDTGVSIDSLRDILEHLKPGSSELMCHPAMLDARLLSGSSYNHQRQRELDVLTSSAALDYVNKCGIKLINFDQIT